MQTKGDVTVYNNLFYFLNMDASKINKNRNNWSYSSAVSFGSKMQLQQYKLYRYHDDNSSRMQPQQDVLQ